MKVTLLIISILASLTVCANTITVKVLEGWKSTPLENSEILLQSNTGEIIDSAKTNAHGIVVFNEIKNGKYEISVSDPSGNFRGTSTWWEVKIKSDLEFQFILKPWDSYIRERLEAEDKKYGTVSPKELPNEGEVEESDTVMTDATFPGGNDKMYLFIQGNFLYPEVSRELGDQGRVYVEFIVEPDGVITHVSVLRRLTADLEFEAMRLVRAMPNWTPATFDGKKVRARCRIPITFTLQ